MADLDIINALEKQLGKKLAPCPLAEVMNADARGRYVLNEHHQIIGLNLHNYQLPHCAFVKTLTQLSKLNLSANLISDCNPLTRLNKLTQLNLSHNQISNIVPLEKLISLTRLQLEANEISQLSALKNLTQLTQLNCRGNKISRIDALKKLQQLTHLYLSGNQIKILPQWITDFNLAIKWDNSGAGISVMANPMEIPPPAIIKQGNVKIKNFFNHLQQQTVNNIKVLLVGDASVGKTSLSRALRNVPVNNPPVTQTLDIQIETWKQNEVDVNLWDFGGKLSLLPTHKLFFSQQILYILVLDNREQRQVERWLQCIKDSSNEALILIVLNKADEPNSYDLERDYLLQRHKGLQGIFSVSAAKGTGFEVFKRGLIIACQHISVFNNPLSLSAFRIKETLESQQKNHCISYQRYLNICDQHRLKQPKLQQSLLQLLHHLGNTLYFNGLDNSQLYICDPQWLIESLYKITTADLIANNNGVLLLNDLSTLLNTDNKENYSETDQHYLIALMQKFYLCFSIDSHSVLIPQLFNENRADIQFDWQHGLHFQIQYNFLDELLMGRFMFAVYLQIDLDKSSRDQLLLDSSKFNCSALIVANYQQDVIDIKINGENKRDYYAFIRKKLYELSL
jgi:small GTP-binding protein